MKKSLLMLALGGLLLTQTAGAAYAESNGAVELVKFPFRIVTGAAGAGLGAVSGSFNGIVDTEQQFAEHTFQRANENPLMVPVGIVGAVVAVPVGIVTGAPKGMLEGGKKGYSWWDDMGK